MTVMFQSGYKEATSPFSGVTAVVSFLNDTFGMPINSPTCSRPMYVDTFTEINTNPDGPTYDNNQTCVWFITVPTGFSPLLQFGRFDTEYGADFFSVYDGPSTSFPLLFRASGQHRIISNVYGSTEQLTVTFSSDAQKTHSGVSVDVTIFDRIAERPVYCPGSSVIDQAGTLISTYYDVDGYYLNNEKCGWLITAPIGFAPMITFIAFDTEDSSDFVTIYDGASISSNVLGLFSGQTIPDPVQATGQNMTVTFISDHRNAMYTGVMALVGFTPLPTTDAVSTTIDNGTPAPSDTAPFSAGYCSEFSSITESGTTISTNPGLPAYINNLRCVWLVSAPAGSTPTITVTFFSVESHFDLLRVFDGPSTTDVGMIATDYWTPVLYNITASQRYMTILFTADASIVAAGVEAVITWT